MFQHSGVQKQFSPTVLSLFSFTLEDPDAVLGKVSRDPDPKKRLDIRFRIWILNHEQRGITEVQDEEADVPQLLELLGEGDEGLDRALRQLLILKQNNRS